MNALFVSLFMTLTSMNAMAQSNNSSLPKTWTKDLIISLSYTGSMDGSSSHVTFTYDSCIYVYNTGMNAL